ncbi:MAG: hypothetical protein HYV09_21140 [Deltaproteobacteria bacterium]|nr:hypothetical protein [Deltaproteobacteria bacterium]
MSPLTGTVGVLALHAQHDDFVEDDLLATAEGRLRAAGRSVAVLRSTRGARTAAEWEPEIRDWVARHDLDVAVILRAWDRALLDSVRGALRGGARLVRLGSRPSALDDAFDAVVDVNGLLELLEGRAPLPARLPASAAEIRSLRLVEPDPAVASTGRPTIRGPAVGCPFLADVRKSAPFRDLPLERGEVQTKGCSFCLDNIGAYAQPPEHAVLESWLRQARAIRAARPDVREVLLVDERPHPTLPAFFRALEAEPALHGLEVMFKSRVDWLFEHEPALVEAIEAARRTGSVVHAYLVGFESFDGFHLELFNKGVSVEQNVAAIAKLRELAARFPDAFEFRKYRAHGVVLFTPWTTPAALRENARVMREVRFDELRSEALRTRLRLQPRTPLHALAERDGLLCASFDEGRTDRAIEQGYDASTPWRFREPSVEAIFRAATQLGALDRSLPEPDVLDAALDLVLAAPGLAEAPELAPLPLLQAAREGDELGVRRAGDAALLSLIATRRGRLVRRCRVAEGAEALARAYRACGLNARAFGDDVVVAGDEAELTPPVAPPPLPSTLRSGVRLGDVRLLRVIAEPEAHALVLEPARAVRVRAHDGRPYALRYGAWAIDVDDPTTLEGREKLAIRALVAHLARGS